MRIMKTATITFHNTKSFGAVLQAYSLQCFLNSLGMENEIIHYSERNTSFQLYSNKKSGKALMNNLDVFLHRKEIKIGNTAFLNFIDTCLNKTKPYHSIEQLRTEPPAVDAFITGSDQVWSAGRGVNPAYFLDFGDEQVRKLSYAASMGKSALTDAQRTQIQGYLKKFKGISVREDTVREILQTCTEKEIETNIDPTFLTSAQAWRAIENPVPGIDKPYILCFMLYRPVWRNEALRQLKKKTGKEIILLDTSGLRNIYHDRQIRSAGPKEFLWLIDHADMVVTTSFHGVAFSSIFGKPLYAIPNPQSPERIVNLMKLLGNEGAIVDNLDQMPYEYDRNLVNQRIEEERAKSADYFSLHLRSVQ